MTEPPQYEQRREGDRREIKYGRRAEDVKMSGGAISTTPDPNSCTMCKVHQEAVKYLAKQIEDQHKQVREDISGIRVTLKDVVTTKMFYLLVGLIITVFGSLISMGIVVKNDIAEIHTDFAVYKAERGDKK